MRPWGSVLFAVAVISAVPLLATMLLAWNASAVRRILPVFVTFGVGALAGTAALNLLPHALEQQPAVTVAAVTLAGFACFGLVERLLGAHDHAHAHGLPLGGATGAPVALAPTAAAPLGAFAAAATHEASPDHHDHPHALLPLNFVADAVHNLVDGVLIAAAFLVDSTVGMATMFAIALHEVPRELGTFAVFVHGGVSPRRAVLFNAATGLVSLLGASLTLLVGPQLGDVARHVLPFAAGTYLFVAWAVGRSALHRDGDAPWGLRLGAAAAGFLAMALGAGLL